MRLINTSTLELHDFYVEEIPKYAILSHTWGNDEVTFQDMSSPDRYSKAGYRKITQTCQLALRDNLAFAWVDTCCIDKSSSAELTESINSMFQWYKNAVVCYAFLEDLKPGAGLDHLKSGLPLCRWFTRGWTLQELLAPGNVEFFNIDWNSIGTKLDFAAFISNMTGIPMNILEGSRSVFDYSIAARMSWAANRQTTRVEDIAYCLLGIFDVNMPLLYGERIKAFRRLQEEIVKRQNDLTIFAWDDPERRNEQFLGLFAESPASFGKSSSIAPFFDDFINFSVTNKGLFISGDSPLRAARIGLEDEYGVQTLRYAIFLGQSSADGGIYLRKFGPKLFYRDGRFPLAGFGANEVELVGLFEFTDYYILIDPINSNRIASDTFRDCAIHVPSDDIFILRDVVPETLWDITDRVFLKPKPYSWTSYPMVLAMQFSAVLAGTAVDLIVLCDYRKNVPICKIFTKGSYPRQEDLLFHGRNRHESKNWVELNHEVRTDESRFLWLSNEVEISVGNHLVAITVSVEKGVVETISAEVELFSLTLNIADIGGSSTGLEDVRSKSVRGSPFP